MEKNELGRRVDTLLYTVESINDWVLNNPDTDPNLYEMVDCLMEYWYIRSFYLCQLLRDPTNHFYDYPIILPNFEYLDYEIQRMLKLRGVIPLEIDDNYKEFRIEELGDGVRIIKSEFFEHNTEVIKFINELRYLAIIGAYPDSWLTEANFNKKKNFYAKIVGVTLYIWQEIRDNPEFIYSNIDEYKLMKDDWDYLMKLYNKKSISYEFECMEIIEHMLDYIKKHSDFDVKELKKRRSR